MVAGPSYVRATLASTRQYEPPHCRSDQGEALTTEQQHLTAVPATTDDSEQASEPEPGSRAARMRRPLAKAVLFALAEHHKVCPHPYVLRRTDTWTGQTDFVEVPCGARLASKCKTCAERIRRLRIQQFREGWHLADEPAVEPRPAGEDVLSLVRLRAHYEFERAECERAGQW